MRPVCVYADVPGCARAQIMDLLHGRWRTATRLIMVVLSAAGMSPAQIADLFDYHPATVRRWLHRYTTDGIPGLPDRPRPGRPRLGGQALTSRITALLATPGPWTIRRIWQHLGRPAISLRTMWRRVRAVARWRRPRLVAKSDPHHDAICARIRRRIARLPAGSVVLAEDEAHLDLLPAVRATWTLRGHRHQIMTPGKNRRATVFGALDVTPPCWTCCWPPTPTPRPSRSSATTTASTTQRPLSSGPPITRGYASSTALPTARTTTRSSAYGPRCGGIWPTPRSPGPTASTKPACSSGNEHPTRC